MENPVISIENKIDYACKGRWYLTAHSGFPNKKIIPKPKKRNIPVFIKLRDNIGIDKWKNSYLIYDTHFGFIYKTNKVGMLIINLIKKESMKLDSLLTKVLSQYPYLSEKAILNFLEKLTNFSLLQFEGTEKFPYLRVQWDITYLCNLSCTHCELSCSPLNKDVLTFGEMKSIVKKLKSKTNFIDFRFSGGEPFASSNFLRLLKYMGKQINCNISILTNGTLIDEQNIKMLEKIKERIKYIRISLAGGQASTNDKIRGKGSFEKIINGIRLLTDRGFFVDVAFDCYKKNIKEIEEAIKLAIKLRCKRFGISFIQPKGNAMRNFRRDELYSFTTFHLERRLFHLAKKYSKKIHVHSLINRMEKYIQLKLPPVPCQLFLHNYIFITPEGDVYPCPEFYTVKNKEEWRIGNLVYGTIDGIFSSPKFLLFKEIDFSKIEKCRRCKYINFCVTGCRIEAVKRYNNIFKPDPHCKNIRKLLSKIEMFIKSN